MNIHEVLYKIKVLAKASLFVLDRRDTYSVFIVIFASLSSYLLGWLSHVESARKPLVIEDIPQLRIQTIAPERISTSEPLVASPTDSLKEVQKPIFIPKTTSGMYVGSKSGSKYHLPTCPSAKKIAAANKVWFQSREEALKAGYSPAGNCPGL
jgi:hypothetical protein